MTPTPGTSPATSTNDPDQTAAASGPSHGPDAAAVVPGALGPRFLELARDIKLAHTVFALPFAILGGALVARGVDAGRLALAFALILVCMVAARTWAMVFNRYADRDIDAANPRTARRALAAGRVSTRDARLALVASAALFLVACAAYWLFQDNPWPLAWAVPVLGWIALYSLTKRFTALCHLVLGVALALSPIAAAVAVAPDAVLQTPALFYLAAYVALWVAGFDVIYALQDLEHDRVHGISSIPARLGWRGALWVSRLLHALAQAMLVGAAIRHDGLGPIFGGAVAIAGLLLIVEHVVLARRGRAGLQMAFFTLNGVISLVLGVAGVIDLALGS